MASEQPRENDAAQVRSDGRTERTRRTKRRTDGGRNAIPNSIPSPAERSLLAARAAAAAAAAEQRHDRCARVRDAPFRSLPLPSPLLGAFVVRVFRGRLVRLAGELRRRPGK